MSHNKNEVLFQILSRVSSSFEIKFVFKYIYRLISGLSSSCYKAVNIFQFGNSITIHQDKRYDEVGDFHVLRFLQKIDMKQYSSKRARKYKVQMSMLLHVECCMK